MSGNLADRPIQELKAFADAFTLVLAVWKTREGEPDVPDGNLHALVVSITQQGQAHAGNVIVALGVLVSVLGDDVANDCERELADTLLELSTR
jgi:hypothetical protein